MFCQSASELDWGALRVVVTTVTKPSCSFFVISLNLSIVFSLMAYHRIELILTMISFCLSFVILAVGKMWHGVRDQTSESKIRLMCYATICHVNRPRICFQGVFPTNSSSLVPFWSIDMVSKASAKRLYFCTPLFQKRPVNLSSLLPTLSLPCPTNSLSLWSLIVLEPYCPDQLI